MAELILLTRPSKAVVSTAPGSTTWTKVAVPATIPLGSVGVEVVIKSMTSAGADGSAFLIALDPAVVPTTVAEGFPISAGQGVQESFNRAIYIKLTASTDLVQCLFAY